MKKILNEYCHSQCEPGLLLLSMPTGFGKTYNVLNFIYEYYEEFAAQKKKILFVTNLKKNLPIQELKERFIADGKEEDFGQHVLFLDSTSGAVVEHLFSIEHEIPERFKTSTYSELRDRIKIITQNVNLPISIKTSLKSELRKQLEPAFRKSITDILHKDFKTKKERLKAIKINPDYQWIGKLYPAVFTDERTVLFLSMDKFIVKNTTLIEPSYYIHERLIENALIFIDEFDATKENVLNKIIESGLRHRVNLLDLFLNIHNHLMQSECPEGLLRESNWRKTAQDATGKEWRSLQQIIDEFRKIAKQIFDEYNLQHTCKSHEDFSTDSRNFLFYDYQFHHVLDARGKYIKIIADSQNRANWITAVKSNDKEDGRDGVNIRSLLGRIAGFLTYFQRGISYLAENYRHLKSESSQDVFPLESAIRTVLNHFRLDTEDVAFLTTNIMEGDMPYGTRTEKGSLQRQGFYDTGFRYHDIVDSDEHDTLSKIYMYNFSRTPESFLVAVCSKAMVVGISATAGLYTNIGNYDLEYLKAQLGTAFTRLTGDTLARLKDAYAQSTQGYSKISIKTEFIDAESREQALESLKSLLNDQEAAQALWHTLRHASDFSESRLAHNFGRYVRALSAWKYFLEHSDCHAFLCFFSKLPKHNDSSFDLTILHKYAKLLMDDMNGAADDNAENMLVVLSSEQFEENKTRLTKELSEGKRRFIISAYQTVGAGQNLQYPIPQSLNPIHINKFPQRSEMDINGLYLDRPTNLIENIYGDTIDDDSFIKSIFQLEFLVENGAIPPRAFKNKLDELFYRYIGKKEPRRNTEDYIDPYQTEAYTRLLNKVIIQAVGRICRTNMKADTIHLLVDASIRKHLARFSLPEDVIPICEYAALLKSAGRGAEQPDSWFEAQNRASSRSNRTMAYIQRQLRTPWTPKSVAEWQALREQVLRQPTIATSDACDARWGSIYVQLPEAACSYRYSEKYDYQDIEVFFSEGHGEKEVSERLSRLPDLMRIQLLRDLFTKSGWATSFPKSTHILTPPMFNNIYKGALGEVCGKHILERFLNIELSELDVEEFECFDFKTNQGIYVDFKLWNDRVAVNADELLDKIRGKMEHVNASRVFIINILGTVDGSFYPIVSADKRIVEIPYLCKNGNVDEAAITFLVKEFCV